MISKLIEITLKKRAIIILLLLAIIAYGIYQYQKLPTDAFPDISPVMVPIFAEAHGMAPEEVERMITFPIESSMNGLPGVTLIKSTSAFGMAVIYIYFEDNVDIYFARQIVAERLAGTLSEMPEMHEPPILGPISTGLGEVFMYYLTADDNVDTEGKDKNTWLRELNDWVVKFQLQTVSGVTEILSMGGHILQYQVNVNPYAMDKHDITLEEIVESINANNANAGGQFLVLGSEEYLVRGIGLIENREHLGDIQVKVVNGTPVRLNDVAEVNFGNELRRGVVSLNGEKEVVAGIVMKLYGENTSKVIKELEKKFPEVQASLPNGVKIVPYYNQSHLVESATGTVKKSLLIGAFLVLLTLLLFLGNMRTAFIVALALPLCALIAVIFMGFLGLSANLMSLGGIAIAIGMLGDASIVMVENIYRHLSEKRNKDKNKFKIIVESAKEVANPILFSVVIIIIVFLPLFTLEGVEGKMFSPMALTISFALLGSLVVALFFAPVLSSLMLKAKPHKEFAFISLLKRIYKPILRFALKTKGIIVGGTLIVFVITMLLIPHLGTEFIPVLEEGAIQVNVTMAPSISLVKATETVMKLEREILKFEEVESTISKIGRPEAGSHPHPVNFSNIQIALKPVNKWKNYKSKEDLIAALNKTLSEYPGIQLNFTQPIQNMFDELLSGVRTQLAIKVYGEDLSILRSLAEEVKEVIEEVPGLVDLSTEQSFGQPQVQVIVDRKSCARYGVNASEILKLVELAVGGEVIDQIFINTKRFGIHVRYQEAFRNSPEAIENLLVHTSEGYKIPLSQVAEVKKLVGPIQINREMNQRRWTVSANVRGRDLGSVVADIQKLVEEKIDPPSGYYIEYGGQFKNQQRAMKKLMIIVPTAFLLIFFLLYLSFGNFRYAMLIFVNVPLALIGGVFGLLLTGEYLSVPASVGFIALFGIAVQNGLVLVSYINQLRREGIDTREAIETGAVTRLRPVLMTALTTVLGLVPLLLSRGMGSEVQRPLAVVVVFGLTSSTFLTLVLIPALYEWFAPKTVKEK
ncbi:MAG: efflux RND transporter permease subunit [Candidatus Cloacimonetes bacterium]|nr:efflux RND transporter permease subunit [Candidatus Cloacimonadota bacterium]